MMKKVSFLALLISVMTFAVNAEETVASADKSAEEVAVAAEDANAKKALTPEEQLKADEQAKTEADAAKVETK